MRAAQAHFVVRYCAIVSLGAGLGALFTGATAAGPSAQEAWGPKVVPGLIGQAVLVAFRVVMTASAHSIGRCAIPILMNVESVLLVWCQSFKVGHHFQGVAVLGKVNDAMTVLTRCRVQHHHGLRNGAVCATHGKG